MLAELEIEAGDPTEVFELIAKLGKGSYASVYKAKDTRDGSVCAIKVLEIEVEDTKALIKEIRILKNCNSEFIVGYKGSFLKENHLWLVMEYCGLGSICDIMSICQKKFTENEIVGVLIQALRGLDYLHKLKMIHRDIKSGNILLNHDGDCKLADFGVSAELENTLAKRKTLIGTPYWMAPEVLQAATYDSAADIWSIGITAYEMAVGHPPHIDKHPLRAIFVIPTLPSPTLPAEGNWSQNFIDFLALCLHKNAKERPSAETLLAHPFLVEDRDKVALRSLVANCRDIIDEFRENQSSDEDSCDEDDEDYDNDGPISPLPLSSAVSASSSSGGDAQQAFEYDPANPPIEIDLDSSSSMIGCVDTGTFHPSPEMTLLLEKVAEEAKRGGDATTTLPNSHTIPAIPGVLVETKPSPTNTLESPHVLRLDTTTSAAARLYRTQRIPDVPTDASVDALKNLLSYMNVAHFQERSELDTYYQQCKNTIHQTLQQKGVNVGTLVQKQLSASSTTASSSADEKSPVSNTRTLGEIGKTLSGGSRKSKPELERKPPLLMREDGGGSAGSRARTPPDLSAAAAASAKSWQIYNEKNSRTLKNLKKKPKIFVTTTISPTRQQQDEHAEHLPQLAGYLYKRGKQSKEWLRRYFVLASGCLNYWANEKDFTKQQNPRGSFTVRGAMVQVYPTGTSPFQDGGLEELKCGSSNKPRKSVFSTLRSGAIMGGGSKPSPSSTDNIATLKARANGGAPPSPRPLAEAGDYSALGSSSIAAQITPRNGGTGRVSPNSPTGFSWPPTSPGGSGTLTGTLNGPFGNSVKPLDLAEFREPLDSKDERDWTVFSLRPVTLDRVYYLVTGATTDLDRKQWLAAIETHGGWLTQRAPEMARMRSQSVNITPLMALSLHTPLARNPSSTRAMSPYHTVLSRSRRASSLLIGGPPPPPPKPPR